MARRRKKKNDRMSATSSDQGVRWDGGENDGRGTGGFDEFGDPSEHISDRSSRCKGRDQYFDHWS